MRKLVKHFLILGCFYLHPSIGIYDYFPTRVLVEHHGQLTLGPPPLVSSGHLYPKYNLDHQRLEFPKNPHRYNHAGYFGLNSPLYLGLHPPRLVLASFPKNGYSNSSDYQSY